MTEEQKAERIHAIVYSCDSREELAERIVMLEDEGEKQKIKFEVLKAHGIEIVDAVAGGYEIYDERQREVDQYKAENAKLRGLVADAMVVLRVAEDELGRDVMVAHYPLLHIRMREIGVEVE